MSTKVGEVPYYFGEARFEVHTTDDGDRIGPNMVTLVDREGHQNSLCRADVMRLIALLANAVIALDKDR